jgi:hypothetical protein
MLYKLLSAFNLCLFYLRWIWSLNKQTKRKQRRALICCEVYFCDAEPFWTLQQSVGWSSYKMWLLRQSIVAYYRDITRYNKYCRHVYNIWDRNIIYGGPGSVVGTAIAYRLDGPGIESRWGRDFPHPSKPAHPASCTMGTGSFPGVRCG